jgi:hypothetical protein
VLSFLRIYGQEDPTQADTKGMDYARLAKTAATLTSVYVYKGQFAEEAQLVTYLASLGNPAEVVEADYALYKNNEVQIRPIMERFLGHYRLRLPDDSQVTQPALGTEEPSALNGTIALTTQQPTSAIDGTASAPVSGSETASSAPEPTADEIAVPTPVVSELTDTSATANDSSAGTESSPAPAASAYYSDVRQTDTSLPEEGVPPAPVLSDETNDMEP